MPDARRMIIQIFSDFFFLFLQKSSLPEMRKTSLFVLSESEFLSNFT